MDEKQKRFYVYVYYDPKNGQPVYVGKGKGNRAISHTWNAARTNDRLVKWINKRSMQGFLVEPEIITETDEKNALLIEEALINLFGRADLNKGPLFNNTDGGDGVSNPNQKVRSAQRKAQEDRWGSKAHHFTNVISGERFTGKPVELAKKIGVGQRQVQKIFNDENVHSVHGWCIVGNEARVNLYNFKWSFINAITNEEFEGTIEELHLKTNLSGSGISQLVNKHRRHVGGWTLKERLHELRPLTITSIGHIEEVRFPWENPKATFESKLSWVRMKSIYDFWENKMLSDTSVGVKTVLKNMGVRSYPEKIYLYERAFAKCRDGELRLKTNPYYAEFLSEFLQEHPQYEASVDVLFSNTTHY